ncbi:hypothetical protein V9T40_000895 [Parthenolecanium corni]|uniref:acid phosphatase n=1 Tax=Parthenolecanium corni TaxID=536013 RepID=A0AAN9TBU7_9HEMI
MFSKFFIHLVVFFLKYSVADSLNFAEDKLEEEYGRIIYASVIFRHGDRTPTRLYPTDPYQNYTWPVDLGQLTNEGKKREFMLGKYFQPRYNCLTGKVYQPTRVIMESSYADRCLMSGELFFAGYFPPIGLEIWNPLLLWQPIPVHTTPPQYDYVVGMTKPCPARDQATQNFYATSPVLRTICTNFTAMFLYIQNYTGLNLSNCPSREFIRNVFSIQDTLLVESQHKLQLPEWANAVFPEPLTYLRSLLVNIEADDPVVARFYAGPLLSVLVSDMLNIAGYNHTIPPVLYSSNASQTRPLHLFSVHDATIATIMRALKMYQNVNPPFGAALGFELRSRDNAHYVTAVYEYSVLEPLKVLQIPGCLGGCTLANFLALVEPLIPGNWDVECQINVTPVTPPFTLPPVTSATNWTDPITTVTPPLPTGWTPPAIPPSHPGVI